MAGAFWQLGFGFQSTNWTGRLGYDFLRVSRVLRVLLILINRPLSLKRRYLVLDINYFFEA
jgi:hypothetical protein